MALTAEGWASGMFGVGDDMAKGVGEDVGGVVWERLYATAGIKAGGRVLAEARMEDGRVLPAVVTMAYGRGRVLAILGEGWWRGMGRGEAWWGAKPQAAGDKGEVMRGKKWGGGGGGVLRWLVLNEPMGSGDRVRLMMDRTQVAVGETVEIEVVSDEAGDVLGGDDAKGQATRSEVLGRQGMVVCKVGVHGEGKGESKGESKGEGMGEGKGQGKDEAIPMRGGDTPRVGMSRRWHGTYRAVEAGEYQAAWLEDGRVVASMMFGVHDANVEGLDTSANVGLMRAIADAGGGLFFQGGDGASHVDELIDHMVYRRAARDVPNGVKPIWNRWFVMAGLVFLLGVEWLIRRWMGWR